MQTLADRPDKKADYVILRSEQLVGTALIVLVKTTRIMAVRNVEASTKKVLLGFPQPIVPTAEAY
jgi:synaptojanin